MCVFDQVWTYHRAAGTILISSSRDCQFCLFCDKWALCSPPFLYTCCWGCERKSVVSFSHRDSREPISNLYNGLFCNGMWGAYVAQEPSIHLYGFPPASALMSWVKLVHSCLLGSQGGLLHPGKYFQCACRENSCLGDVTHTGRHSPETIVTPLVAHTD